MKNASAPTQFATDWPETYGYEAERNYLTSFSTTDGLAGASKTWSYDAAGNRNDATAVDNLNRLTAMSTTNYTNDILGNRLTRTYSNGREATTTWDCLNRMLSYKYYTNTVTTYDYRANGMRTHKAKASTHNYYRYDGQMGMQDVEVKPGVLNITNYGLGARGVDIGSTNGDVWYPVYDGHGNMVAMSPSTELVISRSKALLRAEKGWDEAKTGRLYGKLMKKTGLARHFRKHPTNAEAWWWDRLRARRCLGLKFRRQCPIGPYIVDFVCLEARIILELDGTGHGGVRDQRRDEFLSEQEFRVLRVGSEITASIDEIFERVVTEIQQLQANDPSPHPIPSPLGEGL